MTGMYKVTYDLDYNLEVPYTDQAQDTMLLRIDGVYSYIGYAKLLWQNNPGSSRESFLTKLHVLG